MLDVALVMLLCIQFRFMLYTFHAFCNALMLCSSGCCMPRALGGADAGADALMLYRPNYAFMLYALCF